MNHYTTFMVPYGYCIIKTCLQPTSINNISSIRVCRSQGHEVYAVYTDLGGYLPTAPALSPIDIAHNQSDIPPAEMLIHANLHTHRHNYYTIRCIYNICLRQNVSEKSICSASVCIEHTDDSSDRCSVPWQRLDPGDSNASEKPCGSHPS